MGLLASPDLVTPPPGPASRALVWTSAAPLLSVASTTLGGGLGLRSWVLNAQVPPQYDGVHPAGDLTSIAAAVNLAGDGVGFLTAADVSYREHALDDGVDVWATVGLLHPTWAADGDGATNGPWYPGPGTGAPTEATAPGVAATFGTINVVAVVPERFTEAALVGAITTVTEAKVQALGAASVPGTGTASDAVCVLCPSHGRAESFAGPRARLGAPLARAVYAAVYAGAVSWRERRT
jgi:adenosylcobinamide hydrolase